MMNLFTSLSSVPTLRQILDRLLHTTFLNMPVKWAYPLFRGWFDIHVNIQLGGYILLFGAALIFLLMLRRRKSIPLWCLLYAAEAFSLLLAVTTNHFFVNAGTFPDPRGGIFSFIAAFGFIGLLIATIACHIFVKKTK